MRKQYGLASTRLLQFGALSHLLLIAAEWINRCSGAPFLRPEGGVVWLAEITWKWPSLDPLYWSLNMMIVTGCLWLAASVTGRIRVAVVVISAALLGISLANHEVIRRLDRPLYLTDVRLAGAGLMMSPDLWMPAIGVVMAVACGGVVWIFLVRKYRIARQPARTRMLWLLAASCCVGIPAILLVSPELGRGIAPAKPYYLPSIFFRSNPYVDEGLVFSLFRQAVDACRSRVPEPVDVDQLIMRQLARKQLPPSPSARPHVIIWQSESLWDPMAVSELHAEPDPLHNMRILGKEGRLIDLLVPIYGAGSVRTTFEFLTGMSMGNLPPSVEPYESLLAEKPRPSMCRVFSSYGYDTVVLQTVWRTFASSDKAHANVGFDRYEDETFFRHSSRIRGHVSDSSVASRVVRILAESSKPTLIYVLTMQGHGPYAITDFPQPKIRLSSSQPGLVTGDLTSYCESLRLSDEALGDMTSAIRAMGQPTLLVVYGDHLPTLQLTSDEGLLLRRDGLPPLEQTRRKYSTPTLIWTNTDTPLHRIPPRCSPPVLMSHIFQTLGFHHPFFTDFLGHLGSVAPAFSPRLSILASGELIPGMPPLKEFQEYKAITEDIYYRDPPLTLPLLFPDAIHGAGGK